MGKVEKVSEMREKAKKLEKKFPKWNKLQSNDDLRAIFEKNAREGAKKGNLCLVLGGGVIALFAVLMFMGKWDVGSGITFCVMGAIPFVVGIVRKVNGLNDARYAKKWLAEMDETKKTYESDPEYTELKRIHDELRKLTHYYGRGWDFTNLPQTKANIQSKEDDLIALMNAIAFTDDEQFIRQNWFSSDRFGAATAKITGDAVGVRKEDEAKRSLGTSTSWILAATSIAMEVIVLEIISRALTGKQCMTMDEALAYSPIGAPRDDREKEYWEVLVVAVSRIIHEVEKELR